MGINYNLLEQNLLQSFTFALPLDLNLLAVLFVALFETEEAGCPGLLAADSSTYPLQK